MKDVISRFRMNLRIILFFFVACGTVPAWASSIGSIGLNADAWIESETCTVSGLDRTVDLGTLSRQDIIDSAGSSVFFFKKLKDIQFQITGCEPTLSGKGHYSMTFGAGGDQEIPNKGTSDLSFAFLRNVSGSGDGTQFVTSGEVYEFDVNKPLTLFLYASGLKNEHTVSGTINLTTQMAFDFY
ncbi:hypothetical protein LQX32_004081 [Salmonella enterica]|nr:hypothetical protein [Salmonella enterica]EIO6006331.1 hypothetical protein [Salmonella enterica]